MPTPVSAPPEPLCISHSCPQPKAIKLTSMPSVLELCAGAGGQALGFELAGFKHSALVEIDPHACQTLRFNRPGWKVLREDLNEFDPSPYSDVDVVAGGLPCPPFSKAGKQLGEDDERNLFPAALRVIKRVMPRAVVIENVRAAAEVFSGLPSNDRVVADSDGVGRKPDRRFGKKCKQRLVELLAAQDNVFQQRAVGLADDSSPRR